MLNIYADIEIQATAKYKSRVVGYLPESFLLWAFPQGQMFNVFRDVSFHNLLFSRCPQVSMSGCLRKAPGISTPVTDSTASYSRGQKRIFVKRWRPAKMPKTTMGSLFFIKF